MNIRRPTLEQWEEAGEAFVRAQANLTLPPAYSAYNATHAALDAAEQALWQLAKRAEAVKKYEEPQPAESGT